ncbi:MAG: class I SAM-dependent methyltransferase [Pseudomonadota bacterium]
MANPYKTHWHNRRAAHWLRKAPERAAGTRAAPECIVLEAEGQDSRKPAVRIFLGTEPGQYRATRTFIWSVMKVRDSSRRYEIYLMCDLAGIDREGWKTGFTNYRYAIPHLAGGTGRAIYNDVDQIYLSDPALLFDKEMNGKGVLAIDQKENSVMLIDCDIMGARWTLEDVQAGEKHAHFKGIVADNDLFAPMPGTWNSRDGEYPIEETDCLHYTTLHTQPWKPFPDLLRYDDNPHGGVWHKLEREADAAGYLMFTRDAPSAESRELISLYEQMHEGGAEAAKANPDVPNPFLGWSLSKHTGAIRSLIDESGSKHLLDYGAGKAASYTVPAGADPAGAVRAHAEWPGVSVHCYDPGHPPFSTLEDGPFDGVISTDVVEHLAPFDVAWTLDEMFARARRFVYVVAACYPAKKVLPNGRNAHSVIEPPYWWHQQMALTARRYPDVDWRLVCETRGPLGAKVRNVISKDQPSPLD